MRTLLTIAAVSLLNACGGSTYVEPVIVPCEDPQDLGDGALTDQQIEILWGRDRTNLRNCADKINALITEPAS
jgi:hypothetical protein